MIVAELMCNRSCSCRPAYMFAMPLLNSHWQLLCSNRRLCCREIAHMCKPLDQVMYLCVKKALLTALLHARLPLLPCSHTAICSHRRSSTSRPPTARSRLRSSLPCSMGTASHSTPIYPQTRWITFCKQLMRWCWSLAAATVVSGSREFLYTDPDL